MIAAALPTSAAAGTDVWTHGFELGGRPAVVAAQGATVLAAFNNGGVGAIMLRSTDSGQTWSRVPGFGLHDVVGLQFDPSIAGLAYAATRDGVLRTEDGGQTWAVIDGTGQGPGYYFSIATDPLAPGTAYFSEGIGSAAGVWQTASQGNPPWTPTTNLTGGPPYLMVVDTKHVVWASTGAGIEALGAGSTSWNVYSTGLGSNLVVTGLAADPSGTGRVIAGTETGVYWIVSGGSASWAPLDSGLPPTPFFVDWMSGDAAGDVYLGILLGGVYELAPGASSWHEIDQLLPSTTLAIDGDTTTAGRAFALATGPYNAPIYISTDAGASWRPAGTAGFDASAAHAVVADPTNAGTLWAAAQGDGIQVSHDGGATWSQASAGLPGNPSFNGFARAPDGALICGVQGKGLYRSTDGGASWQNLPGTGQVASTRLVVDPSNDAIYAASGNAPMVSTDDGTSWTALPAGGLAMNTYTTDLAPDPAQAGAVYLATSTGVYDLDAGASTWSSRSNGLGSLSVSAILADPSVPGRLFAETTVGLFRSDDGGASWSSIQRGLDGTNVYALIADPSRAGTIYAATDAGIDVSSDAGQTWSRSGAFSDVGTVISFSFDADGHTLYGASPALGVVERTQTDPPVSVAAPAITGTAAVGVTLTGQDGSWTGFPSPTLSRQWERCTGSTCSPIPGATGHSYAVVAADAGHRLELVVTATNADSTQTAASAQTAAVLERPRLASRPALTGVARVGHLLRVNLGAWEGFPAPMLTVAWLRCNRQGRHCRRIRHHAGNTYRLLARDRGHRFQAVITATSTVAQTRASTGLTPVVR